MSDATKVRTTGVRTIDDILARSVVDDITGCWNWQLAISDNGKIGSSRTPRTSIPAGVLGSASKSCSVSAPRAAWLLSGRKLRDGDVVWRTCCNDECVAPEHLKAGTKAAEGKWMAASGHRRGHPKRAAINLRNATGQAVCADTVAAIVVQLDAGVMHRKVAADFGLHLSTICKISCGKHFRQRRGVRGSSVFNLGGGAA